MEIPIFSWNASTFTSTKLLVVVMSPALFLWISSQVLWTPFALDLSVNYSARITSYSVRLVSSLPLQLLSRFECNSVFNKHFNSASFRRCWE